MGVQNDRPPWQIPLGEILKIRGRPERFLKINFETTDRNGWSKWWVAPSDSLGVILKSQKEMGVQNERSPQAISLEGILKSLIEIGVQN